MKKKTSKKTKQVEKKPVSTPVAKDYSGVFVKLLVVLQLLLLGLQFSPSLCTNGDNARYFILGKSLAQGSGYRQIDQPDAPKEKQYPLGLPLLISAAQKVIHTPLGAKILISFFGVLSTLFCFYWLKGSAWYILYPVLSLVAFSGYLAEFNSYIMSETPYLSSSLLAIILLYRSLKNTNNRLLFFCAIGASLLPVNFRSAGIAFSVAWLVFVIMKKQYKYLIAHVIGLIVTLGATRILSGDSTPYIVQLLQKNSYIPELGLVTFTEMIQRILNNIGTYSTLVIGQALVPLGNKASPDLIRTISCTATLLIFIGWLSQLIEKRWFISLYIFFYFGILCLWQEQWSSTRFIIGIIPFLYHYLILGMFILAQSISKRKITLASELFTNESKKTFFATKTIVGVSAILLIVNISYQAGAIPIRWKLSYDWENFFSCADWVRTHTGKSAVVISRKPGLFYLRSNRSSLIYPFSHDVDNIITFLRKYKVTHVVIDGFYWSRTTAKYMSPVILNHPKKFKVVYALQRPHTYVLEFVDQ